MSIKVVSGDYQHTLTLEGTLVKLAGMIEPARAKIPFEASGPLCHATTARVAKQRVARGITNDKLVLIGLEEKRINHSYLEDKNGSIIADSSHGQWTEKAYKEMDEKYFVKRILLRDFLADKDYFKPQEKAATRGLNKSYYTLYIDKMVNDQATEKYTVYVPVGPKGHEADLYMELYRAVNKENGSRTWMFWKMTDGKIVRKRPPTSRNVMTYEDWRGAMF